MLGVITAIVAGATLVAGGYYNVIQSKQSVVLENKAKQYIDAYNRYVALETDEVPCFADYIVNGEAPKIADNLGKWITDMDKIRHLNEKINIESHRERLVDVGVEIIQMERDGFTKEQIEEMDFRNVLDWSCEMVREMVMGKNRTIYRYHFVMKREEGGLYDPDFTYDEYAITCLTASGIMLRNKSMLVFDDHPEMREQCKKLIARYGHFAKMEGWRKTI